MPNKIEYVSICSPNYLPDSHIRFELRNNTDVICEKPIVLNPWNVEAIKQLENETWKNNYNILQLRVHPSVVELKNKGDNGVQIKFMMWISATLLRVDTGIIPVGKAT